MNTMLQRLTGRETGPTRQTQSTLVRRIVNAYSALRENFKMPKSGRVIAPHRNDFNDFFSADLTMKKLLSMYESVINGDARDISALYDRMLYRDPHIRAESNKRFTAVKRLPWEILAATPLEDGDEDFNPELAAKVASHCRRIVRRHIAGFPTALDHLTRGRDRGAMVVEIEHRGGIPVAAHCIPFNCLRYDDLEPWRMRISVGADWKGVAIDEFPAGQFIVHAPELLGGNAFAGGLLFATLMWYCLGVWNQKFLFSALELFGQPLRIGKYRENATADEIAKMKSMLLEMGATAAGVFQQGSEVEMVTAGIAASGAAWPQERVHVLKNTEITKLWLGGTLTTAMDKSGGSFAAATVHEGVAEDLRDDDCAKLSDTITQQLIRPLVAREFGAEGLAHLPTFRHVVEEEKDLTGMADLADKAVNRLGVRIPRSWVTQELGLPQVKDENLEEALPGMASGFDSLAGLTANSHRLLAGATQTRDELRVVANRALDSIRTRKGAIAKLVPFILAAVIASQAHVEQVTAAIADAIDKHESRMIDEAGIGNVLAEVFAALPTEDMAELVRQAILFAELSGRAAAQARMHRLVAGATQAGATREALQRGAAWLVVNAERIDFARLPFVEAIEALRDRIGLDPDTFEQLDAEARSRAFRVAAVYDMDLLAVAHTALVQSIAAGETARDFKLRTLPGMADRKGWTGENPWHADVVFYQNFAMAHMAGAHRQMVDLEVPAWRFASNGDSCPICEPFVGKIFKLSDRRNYPPLHFYCDCDADPVFEDEFTTDELADIGNLNAAALAEYRKKAGAFAFDPAHYAALEPIRLDKYPSGLRPAFENLAKEKKWEVTA